MDEQMPRSIDELRDVITVKELSSFLRTTPKKIYRLADNGYIKSFKVGKSVLFLKDEVLSFMGIEKIEHALEPKPKKEEQSRQPEALRLDDRTMAYGYSSTYGRHQDYQRGEVSR